MSRRCLSSGNSRLLSGKKAEKQPLTGLRSAGLLLYLTDRFFYGGYREQDGCEKKLRKDIGKIISEGIKQRIHSFRGVFGEEHIAGDHMEQIAADDADGVSDYQAVFFAVEKSAQPQSAEGQGIVEQHLERCIDVRAGDQLQDPIGDSGDEAGFWSIEVSDEGDELHAEQGNIASIGKIH